MNKMSSRSATTGELANAQSRVRAHKASLRPSESQETSSEQVAQLDRLVPRYADGSEYYDLAPAVIAASEGLGVWFKHSALPLAFLIGTLFGGLACAAVSYLGH